MMGQYRKKPVVIEAWNTKTGGAAPDWLQQAEIDKRVGFIPFVGGPGFTAVIKTLEGELVAPFGSWIIRGIKGELYPCDDEIFRATYDPVTEEDRGELRTVEQAVIPAPDGRQPIATAPKDGTHIIIAVTCLGRVPVIGSAYWQAGDWWWAGTGPTFYGSCPVSEANFGAPEFWWPMPTLGA